MRLGELYVTGRECVNGRDASRYMILSTPMDVELSLRWVDFRGTSMRQVLLAALFMLPMAAHSDTVSVYRSTVVFYDANTDKTQYLNCDVQRGIADPPQKYLRYVLVCDDRPSLTLTIDKKSTASYLDDGRERRFPLTVLNSDANWKHFSFGTVVVKFYPPEKDQR